MEVQITRIVLVGGWEQYNVCKKDKELSVEQCNNLVHTSLTLTVFRISSVWTGEGGWCGR